MKPSESHSRELGPDGRLPAVGYAKFRLAYDSHRQQAPHLSAGKLEDFGKATPPTALNERQTNSVDMPCQAFRKLFLY
jgi:hypothetical protein